MIFFKNFFILLHNIVAISGFDHRVGFPSPVHPTNNAAHDQASQGVGQDPFKVLPLLAIEEICNTIVNSEDSFEYLDSLLVCRDWNMKINRQVRQYNLTRGKLISRDKEYLSGYISRLESLESLTLKFLSDSTGPSSNLLTLQELLKILPYSALSKLNQVDLFFAAFREKQMDSSDINNLANLLKQSRGFISVCLTLGGHQMGADGLKTIVRALRERVVDLTKLDLGLWGNDIQDDQNAISDLTALLVPSDSLRVLHLHMSSDRFGDNSLIALAELLRKKSSSLVDLKLMFFCHGVISNDGVIALAEALATLNSPGIHLHLVLDVDGLFDDGMLALVRAVVSLGNKNLVKLEFFLSSHNVSQPGAAEAIRLLRSIKKLTQTPGSMGLESLQYDLRMSAQSLQD